MKKPIRNYVIPIFSGKWASEEFEYKESSGTAFIIGKNGYAITAAHVLNQIDIASSAVAIVIDDQWLPIKILGAEKHPHEDVAILRLQGTVGPSFMAIGSNSEFQACDYQTWGYPIYLAELGEKYNEDKLQTPELVFSAGHIRRRISKPLPTSNFLGSSFYELSAIAGDGCSGGPVIAKSSQGKNLWEVIGIYIGAASFGVNVGYAVRTDVIYDWMPKMLLRTIREESLDV